MRAVIQRVSSSQVVSDGVLTGKIGKGLTILLGVKKGDSEKDAQMLALKISKLRIYSDKKDKMQRIEQFMKKQGVDLHNFIALSGLIQK